MAVDSEVTGRLSHSPGSVEPFALIESMQQTSGGREDVNEAESRTVYLIVLCAVLFGEGYIKIAANVLNVEGSESVGYAFIFEGIVANGDAVEIRVVNIHVPFSKVGHVEIVCRTCAWVINGGNGHSFEDRCAVGVDLYNSGRWTDSGIPTRESAVFRNEKE